MPWGTGATQGWLAAVQTSFVFVFMLIPVAVGIAIQRHRLYSIDVIVSRRWSTVVSRRHRSGPPHRRARCRCAPTRGYGPGARRPGRRHVDVGRRRTVRPLRRGTQALIDRRFYRRRYDVQQAATAFAVRVCDEVDLAALGTDLVDIVTTTIQPSTVWLWVKPSRPAGAARSGP
jgi:hypothetical protein